MANATAATATPGTDAPAPTDAKPRSRKKLLIIGLSALALAGGGAAFFLSGDKTDKKAEPKVVQKAPAQYIALEPPFVVNFDASEGARFLQVTVQLMTRELEMAEFIRSHDPVIRNDLLLLLGNQKVMDVSSREGKEQLRLLALETVRQIIESEGREPKKLEAVYFTSFVMQ